MSKIVEFMKDRKKMYIFTIIFSMLFILLGNRIALNGEKIIEGLDDVPQKIKITKIISDRKYQASYAEVNEIVAEGRFLSGENRGEVVKIVQEIDNVYTLGMKKISHGDKILGYYEPGNSSGIEWVYGSHVRFGVMISLLIIFLILLIVLGGKQGINTIVSMSFTGLAIFVVYIPSIMSGKNIYLWSIGTCLFIIFMTLGIVNGVNRKSVCASLGCVGGVLIAGMITLIMDKAMFMTGMVGDESMYLSSMFGGSLDLNALMFSGIIIGATGAIMDVSMSIASSLKELVDKNKNINGKELMSSGMNIGRDIMGTMANTLVLAYIGGAIGTVLLIICYNTSLLEILNKEMVAAEVLQALAGSMGILLAIPLTTFLCSKLYIKLKR